jgi:hypothetical protein
MCAADPGIHSVLREIEMCTNERSHRIMDPRNKSGSGDGTNAQSATFSAFVERHRLRTKRDACGEILTPGRFGHLYSHDAGLVGLVFEDARNGQSRIRTLLARRRRAVAGGFRLHQAGDAEAILLFVLNNAAQEKLALRLLEAKRRRIPSLAQLETLRRAREAAKACQTPAQRLLQDVATLEIHGEMFNGRPILSVDGWPMNGRSE